VTVNPIPIKAALKLAGLPSGALRLPLVEADSEQVSVIAAAMESVGIGQVA